MILWWGGWSSHHFSLYYFLYLEISILRHLYIRIRESILSISLSSRLRRAIGQSPYQSRILAVISRYVYRPSVVQLLVWVFILWWVGKRSQNARLPGRTRQQQHDLKSLITSFLCAWKAIERMSRGEGDD